jgi:hypothetical protein
MFQRWDDEVIDVLLWLIQTGVEKMRYNQLSWLDEWG